MRTCLITLLAVLHAGVCLAQSPPAPFNPNWAQDAKARFNQEHPDVAARNQPSAEWGALQEQGREYYTRVPTPSPDAEEGSGQFDPFRNIDPAANQRSAVNPCVTTSGHRVPNCH